MSKRSVERRRRRHISIYLYKLIIYVRNDSEFRPIAAGRGPEFITSSRLWVGSLRTVPSRAEAARFTTPSGASFGASAAFRGRGFDENGFMTWEEFCHERSSATVGCGNHGSWGAEMDEVGVAPPTSTKTGMEPEKLLVRMNFCLPHNETPS